MKVVCAMVLAAAMVAGVSGSAQVVVKHVQTEKAAIATGVWVGDTSYLSGQLASPATPADAASVFAKIQAALQDQGLDMKDVVKMTVFLGPDPKTSKLDFAGMQSEYVKFFGTKDQPNKPARSAFQVAALAAPWALLEIEVIAVKSK